MSEFYKDLLSVEGYFQHRFKNDMLSLKSEMEKAMMNQKELSDMDQELDFLFCEVEKLSKRKGDDLGNDIRSIRKIEVEKKDIFPHAVFEPEMDNVDELFEAYRRDAYQHGFKEVHMTQVLTSEEMQYAMNLEEKINSLFDMRASLRTKESGFLVCAIVFRVLCAKAINGNIGEAISENKEKAFAGYASEEQQARVKTTIGEVKDVYEAVSMFEEASPIRNPEEIMAGCVPFAVEDGLKLQKSDILGYSKGIGWFVGMLNILTGTVTDKSFKTYMVDMADFDLPYLLEETVSLRKLVMAAITAMRDESEAVLCSVLREAEVQNCKIAKASDIEHIVNATSTDSLILEQAISMIQGKLENLRMDIVTGFSMMEMNKILDKIISYIAAVQYDETVDGDLQSYTLRINEVLSLSAAVAAMLTLKDIGDGKIGGLLVHIMELISSSKFWIQAKSAYLENIHKKTLDEIWKHASESVGKEYKETNCKIKSAIW